MDRDRGDTNTPPAKTREPWLGDALRALHALAPGDAATVRGILALLSLPLTAVGDAAAAAPQRLTGNAAPDEAAAATAQQMRDAAASAAARHTAVSDESQRLPSRLKELASVSAAPVPAWLSSTPALLLPAELARPAPAPPLLPRQRRRAILTALLHETVEEGEPDLPRIVARLSRGRALQRVPRRRLPTLRHGVELRLDRAPWLQPFHADQTELRDALVRLLPPGRVAAHPIEGRPEPRPPQRRAAPAPRLASPTPHLLLSDLGAGWRGSGEAPAGAVRWREWIREQQVRGRRVVVLSPLPGAAATGRGATVLPWNERLSIGDALRARAGQPLPEPAAPGDEQTQQLARELSPALVASPALLRRTRLDLGLPPAAEAALIDSDVVQSHGSAGTIFDPAAVQALRRELAAGPRLGDALARQHAERGGRRDGTAIEEALVALELQGRLDEASCEEALRPALKALAEGGGDDAAAVADWVAHAWTRMSPAAQRTMAARQLAFAAARHGPSGWLADGAAATPRLPVLAPWLLGDDGARRDHVVQLRRYGDGSINLVVGPAEPETSAMHRIDLPAAAPWLQVAHGGNTQLVALAESRAVQVDLPSFEAAARVEIAAADGDRWQLSATDDPQNLFEDSVLLLPAKRGVALCVAPGLAIAQTESVQPPFRPGSVAPGLEINYGETGVPLPTHTVGTAIGGSVEVVTYGGELSPARVVGREVVDGRERLAIEFTPFQLLRPFDDSAHLPTAGSVDRLFGLRVDGPPQVTDLVPVGNVLEARAPAEHLRTTLGLIDYVNRGWHWIDRMQWIEPRVPSSRKTAAPSKGQQAAAATANERLTIELVDSRSMSELRQWAEDCAERQYLLFIVETEGFESAAHELWDGLVSRWGTGRAHWDHDGRQFGDPESRDRVLQPRSRLVLLGTGPLGLMQADVVTRAAAAGQLLLWAPLVPTEQLKRLSNLLDPERRRIDAQWPSEVANAIGRRRPLDAQAVPPLIEQVAAWQTPRLEAAVEEPVNAASEPAPPASAPPRPAGSLRQRLIAMIENREEQDLGLFRIDLRSGLALEPASTLPTDRALLLFVHGITGSTEANFGALLKDDPALAARLPERYGDAIFAWHYRSLSVGPAANALMLARALPLRARLHLVTYSAGGVIGELLCRGMRSDGSPPFDVRDQQILADTPATEPDVVQHLAALGRELSDKAFEIERFVRISAPIEGSVVYGSGARTSVKLARVLPFIGGIVSALPGIESLLADPAVVPGAAALVPGAGVQPLLTRQVRVRAPLSVITGVHEARSLAARASAWFARAWSPGRDDDALPSDLWVSLRSALGGLERDGGIEYFVEVGEQVDHAAYLRIASVRRALVDALLAESQPAPGFTFVRSMRELQASAPHAAA